MDKVIYKRDEQIDRLKTCIERHVFDEDRDSARGLYIDMLVTSLFFKAEGFAVEREWRGVRVLPGGDHERAEFRTSLLGVVPYTKHDFSATWSSPEGRQPVLKAIRVGPTSYPYEAAAAVRVLLDKTGFTETCVKTSSIRHRLVR